jgi:hypothetical protein
MGDGMNKKREMIIVIILTILLVFCFYRPKKQVENPIKDSFVIDFFVDNYRLDLSQYDLEEDVEQEWTLQVDTKNNSLYLLENGLPMSKNYATDIYHELALIASKNYDNQNPIDNSIWNELIKMFQDYSISLVFLEQGICRYDFFESYLGAVECENDRYYIQFDFTLINEIDDVQKFNLDEQ